MTMAHGAAADVAEVREWEDALDDVLRHFGPEQAAHLLEVVTARARRAGVRVPESIFTPYCNTIPAAQEKRMPGDLFMERRIRSLVRWNALAMVMRANRRDPSLGGHISTFSSIATLYDVGFNYFFRGDKNGRLGDLIYFQGHSSPGLYAYSYLEERLSERQLDNFRREVDGDGLSSYPHPWLMPDYWQFPTVSMGLGPIQAIYQAHLMKYQANRGLVDHGDRKVWCYVGDGECDEPESLGVISLAGREQLDNLIFVVNCNLQRLDGPVRGNGKIIQELEGAFRGAGWNVIKVIWGRLWDPLLEQDDNGVLQRRMDEAVDGDYQNYRYNGGSYTREHFFGKSPELQRLVEHLSDDDIFRLNRGGHDPYKVYAAYSAAVAHRGQPTVILAKTVKGYGMGKAGEAGNETHSLKKLSLEDLKTFRDRFGISISDDEIADVPYYRPPADSPEISYMRERRAALGGCIPQRRAAPEPLRIPPLTVFDRQLESTGEREISTTMAFVRILSILTEDQHIGERIVPIIPDEARTFGMEGLFRKLGIYSSQGQLYTPVDSGKIMYYKEDAKGQILEEGLNEPGAFSAWLAAGTSYSANAYPMIPFYAFYSMFGFQRVGDLSWAAGDAQARGFLIGATAGRTTLNGEGLQHQDGHSHLLASTIPNCVGYDPCYSYELAVIIQDGLRRMYQECENCFYYITTMNENYAHPQMPGGAEDGIVRGAYLLEEADAIGGRLRVQLLGSGAVLREVREAARILLEDFDVAADVYSVTSFTQLRRDGLQCERWNFLHPGETPRVPYLSALLAEREGPVIAATDYMRLVADQVRSFVPYPYRVLGTDGFGRSDTRSRLRHFFEVDRRFITLAALSSLVAEGALPAERLAEAFRRYEIDPEKPNPMLV